MADQPGSIFEEQAPQQQQQENTPTDVNTQLAHLLGSIKNERGEQKYDSLPKALEGLTHAQQYIPELKSQLSTKDQEIERLRAELAQRESVEDVVSRLTAKNQPQEQDKPPVASGLDEGAVMKLLEQMIGKREQESAAQANLRQVEKSLTDKYGEKAREVIQAQAKELGLSQEDFKQWAQRSPAAVLKLFNASHSVTSKTTTSSINIPPIQTHQEPLKAPEKSLLAGATSREQTDYMQEIKRRVYERNGISQ